MPAYNPGALVLYHAKSATVTAVNKEKIEIRIEGGDTKSVRPKDIEFLHPGPVRSLPPAALPAPDAQELSALMEGETLPFGDFAELAYGTRSPEAYYSAWTLLQEGIYFSGSIETGVTARSQEEIAESLAALREKEARQLRRAELLERIRSGALLPEDLPAMREIEQVALGETASSRLLRELGIEAVPPKAHELLLKLGVWDLFVDPWPARMGVNLETPEIELGALPPEPRTDLTHLAALAIDDEGSNDPDDAISYEDGVLWVHVADPAALVTPGSPADDEAMNRGENLYLPEKIVPMLPAGATTLFGLGLQPVSPAISFAIRIAEDGSATLEKMELSTVRVERLTYGGAAAHWEESPLRELRPMLERFKARRKADGALFIDLPEVKIRVENREVKITPLGITPERELVANAMLAAGSAVACDSDSARTGGVRRDGNGNRRDVRAAPQLSAERGEHKRRAARGTRPRLLCEGDQSAAPLRGSARAPAAAPRHQRRRAADGGVSRSASRGLRARGADPPPARTAGERILDAGVPRAAAGVPDRCDSGPAAG